MIRKNTWNERGAAAMEFALILPVLAALVFGVIDFGRLLYTQEVLNNAAREGARFGIKSKAAPVTDSQIQALVNNTINNSQLAQSSDVTSIPITRTGGGPVDLSVAINYNFKFLVANGLIPGLSATRPMVATAVMRMEGT